MSLGKNLEREMPFFERENRISDALAAPYMIHFSRDPGVFTRGVPYNDGFYFYRHYGTREDKKPFTGVKNRTYHIFHDTKMSIVLAHDKIPLACSGFACKNEPGNLNASVHTNDGDQFLPEGVLCVEQLQASGRFAELLSLFRWERMLLALTSDWAYQAGFDRIAVLPSSRNFYTRDKTQDDLERLKIRYDVTAEREGFAYDSGLRLFVRNLR